MFFALLFLAVNESSDPVAVSLPHLFSRACSVYWFGEQIQAASISSREFG
jgi:hypothetical protein